MNKKPHSSESQAKAPLSDELKFFRSRKRRSYKSPSEYAREQAYSDWLEAPLPIDEKKRISSLHDVLVKLLPEIRLETEGIQKEQLAAGWKRAAGEFISNNAELVSINNGVALVKVIQPTLRYHLNQWHAPLLEKLRHEFRAMNINSLKFIFG